MNKQATIKQLRTDQLQEITYGVTFADVQLPLKPLGHEVKTFQRIHNELESNESRNLTLNEILYRVEHGQPFKNGIYEIDKSLTQAEISTLRDLRDTDIDKYVEQSKAIESKKKPVFKRTNLAILDIDDVRGSTDPYEVMETLGAIACYFSYSDKQTHLKDVPMRRYRLLFRLSEQVKDINELSYIQEQLKQELVSLYPTLRDEQVQGKDNGIDNIVNGFFYGTNKKSLKNEEAHVINIKPYKMRYKELEAEKQLERELKALRGNFERDVSEQGLNDMVEHIGGLNLTAQEWFSLAIGVWHTAQLKGWNDENVASQLQALDNDEHDLSYYYQYKRPIDEIDNPSTIGSLIYHAQERGYKLKPSDNKGDTLADTDKKEITDIEKIERYISADQFLNILNNPYRTNLIVSDTNTGKTRASIEASRAYLEQHKGTFIYIAVPTTAIAEQNAIQHKVNRAIFGRINVKEEINKAIYKDDRLLIGTYDKAPIIKDNLNNHNLIVIMDEAHKAVTDYSYRYKAISSLFELVERNEVVKFIGLTGTPYELNFKEYEHIKRFELESPKVLAEKLNFIEFNKVKEFDPIVLNQIQKNVQEGNKALVLIDNKEKADYFQRTLKGVNINATVISADTKQSSSYRYLLENERFADDVDVILATRAIADGININNKTNNYVTIIAPLYHGGGGTTETADFYNLDLIRQTANRLRFKYKEIIIPLFIPSRLSDTRKGSKPYDLERQYSYLMNVAKVVQTVVKHNYKGNIESLRYSTIELINGLSSKRYEEQGAPFDFERAHEELTKRDNGLRYDFRVVEEYEEIRDSLLEIDKRMIRAQASRNKEEYYKYNPYAFKVALERALDVDKVVTSDIEIAELDSKVANELDVLRALQEKADDEKREHLREALNEIRFNKIKERYYLDERINEDEELLKELKKAMNPIQYRTLLDVVRYLDYEQAIQELEYATKLKHRNELSEGFEAINDIESFQTNNHVTARMFTDISNAFKELEQGVTAKERDELLDEVARGFKFTNNATYKKLKDRQKDFKKIFKQFFIKADEQRNERARLAVYEPISFKWIAQERGITTQEIKERYKGYAYYKRL